jgi:hypothetical protein
VALWRRPISTVLSARTFKVQQKLAYSKKHVGTDALVCPAERSSTALRTAVCYRATEEGAGPSFPNKISSPAAAPSLSLRSLQGQGGELDLPSSAQGDQNPRSSGGAPGVPARVETRQERGTLSGNGGGWPGLAQSFEPTRVPRPSFAWAGPLTFFHHKRDVRAITDLLPNRCEDTSTVHHRELRQSPETNAFPAANFSPLFDNIWPRSAPPQVHAKQKNQALSPIFVTRYM